jgi:hypothetical protein
LQIYLQIFPVADDDELLFEPFDDHAAVYRRDLGEAGITAARPELLKRTKERNQIWAHDTRAALVTVALAIADPMRDAEWIKRRTGHTSPAMLNTYQHASAEFPPRERRWFAPMDQAIPELGEWAREHGFQPVESELTPSGASEAEKQLAPVVEATEPASEEEDDDGLDDDSEPTLDTEEAVRLAPGWPRRSRSTGKRSTIHSPARTIEGSVAARIDEFPEKNDPSSDRSRPLATVGARPGPAVTIVERALPEAAVQVNVGTYAGTSATPTSVRGVAYGHLGAAVGHLHEHGLGDEARVVYETLGRLLGVPCSGSTS